MSGMVGNPDIAVIKGVKVFTAFPKEALASQSKGELMEAIHRSASQAFVPSLVVPAFFVQLPAVTSLPSIDQAAIPQSLL